MSTLKRHIGFWGVYFTAISASIGSGWLFSPFLSAQLAGPLAVLAWPLAAILLFPILICFIEMSYNIPVTGGLIRFIQATHGNFLSFICSWFTWLSAVIIPPIEVEATLQYSSYYFPEVIHTTAAQTELTGLGLCLAAILMLTFVCINYMGVKLIAKINSIISFWKLIIPFISILCMMFYSFKASNFSVPVDTNKHHLADMFAAIATGGIAFSLIGFRVCIEMCGEIANPKENIIKPMLLGFVTCVTLYTCLQIAFIGALEPADFANGWKQLHFANDASPIVGVIAAMGLVWLVSILYLDAMISPSGSGLLFTASTARILYAISNNGFFPQQFKKLNRYGVPANALLLNFCVGMMFFFPFSGWKEMASFLVLLSIIAYGLGAISVFAMRRQNSAHQTFRLSNVVSFIAFYCTSLYIYWTGWKDVSMLFYLSLIGTVIYGVFLGLNRGKRVPFLFELKQSLKNMAWLIVFEIGLVLISYFGQFGGTKAISFGWDYLLLFLLSMPIYFIAIHCRLTQDVAQKRMQELVSEATSG